MPAAVVVDDPDDERPRLTVSELVNLTRRRVAALRPDRPPGQTPAA